MTRDEVIAFFRYDVYDDELILWAGQPDTSVHLNRADILLIPVSLWLGYTIIRSGLSVLTKAVTGLSSPTEALVYAAVSVPFLAAGFYVLIGRFLYKSWRKKRTFYAVTNKRILVLALTGRRRLLEQSLDDIPALHLTTGLGGTGTITFGRSSFASSWCTNTGMICIAGFDRIEFIAFHDIKEFDHVYAMIDSLKCIYDKRCYPFSPDMTTS